MRSRIRIFLFIIVNAIITVVQGQVTFIIESLPNTTPEEDTLFICGTFNEWNVHDIKYMLRPQLNGTYSISLPADTGTIEYKFVRGSWMKWETNEKNEYCPNRKFTFDTNRKVRVKIINWQDLGGVKSYNYMVLFLFASAFYGLSLLFLVYRIQKTNILKYRTFFALNIIIILTLLGGVLHNQTNLIWQSHIAMLGYLIFFAWSPTLALFLNSLRSRKIYQHLLIHYLPSLFLLLLALLRLLNFKPILFLLDEINPYMNLGNSILMLLGIGVNTFYHLKLFKILQLRPINEERLPREILLVNSIFFISSGALLMLMINFILLLAKITWSVLLNFEAPLIIISGIIIVEFYYFWKFPEILRDKAIQNPIGNSEDLISRLDKLMQKQKPFKNPELNIAELSDMLETKPHILSKVINERFNKNYRDFINEYRVNEFIKSSISDKYKNYTFLALAHEVGFNSKSTFNLAFKKVTKLSPRDYLKHNHTIIKL